VFLRIKNRGANQQIYIVRSYRDECGNPRQKIVKYLGSTDPSRKSSGALTLEQARRMLEEEIRRRRQV
jgi:hypothetical protein